MANNKNSGYEAWKKKRETSPSSSSGSSGYEAWKQQYESGEGRSSSGYEEWKQRNGRNGDEDLNSLIEQFVGDTNSFYDSYNARSENGWQADSGDWLKTVQNQYDSSNAAMDEILQAMNRQSGTMSADYIRQLNQMLNETRNNMNTILENTRAGNDFYSQFSGAEEYDRWMAMPKREDGSIDMRALARQAADALSEYERGMEPEASTSYAEQNRGIADVNSYGAAASAPRIGDPKHKELSTQVDYYEMLANRQADEDLTAADMAQIDAMTDEEKRDLQTYVTGRSGGDRNLIDMFTGSMQGNTDQVVQRQLEAQAAYRRLAEKYGEEAVRNYAETYGRYLNAGTAEQMKAWGQLGAQNTWANIGQSAASVLANTAGNITSPLGAVSSMITNTGRYSTLDPNNFGTMLNTYGSSVRETVSGRIEGEDPTFGKKALATVYRGGMSALDNLARIAMTGGNEFGSLALAGTGSFGQTVAEASANGASPLQAAGLGIVSGAAEILTEKMSLDSLLGIAERAPGSRKEVIASTLKQAGTEVIEEEVSLLANTVAEALILQGQNGYRMSIGALMDSGMSYEEAKKVADRELVTEALMTAAESFISGGFMSGPAMITGYASDQNRDTRNQYASEAEARLDELGAEGDLQELARIVARQTLGENLTRGEQKKLSGSEAAQQVAAEFAKNDPLRTLAEETAAQQATAAPQTTPGQEQRAETTATPTENQTAQKAAQEVTRDTAKAQPTAVEIDESWMDDTPAEPAQAKPAPAPTEAKQTAPEQSAQKPSRTVSLWTEGKDAEITGIESMGKDGTTYRLSDGTTVTDDDVVFASDSDAAVYQTIKELGITADEGNILLDGYYAGNVSGEVFARGIQNAFTYGKVGMSAQDAASRSEFVQQIGAAAEFAHRMGVQARKAEVAAQQAARTSNRAEATKTARKGEVTVKVDTKKASKMQKGSIEALKVLAEVTGINIVVDTNLANNANGVYDPRSNTVTIDLNAGSDYSGTMLYTAAHELTHFIKQWNPQKFDTLAQFLVEQYGQQGKSVSELVEQQRAKAAAQGVEISEEVAFEEFVADSMEAMLADGEVLAKLKQRDQSIWEKIRDYITELAKKIRKAYEKLTPDSEEGRIVAQMGDKLAQIQEMFADALLEAGEIYQGFLTMEPNTDVIPVEEGVRHSYRSLAQAAGFTAQENEDGTRSFVRNGAKVTEVTVADIENSPIGALINYSLEQGDIPEEAAQGQKEMFATICTMAAKSGDFAMSMQFMGSTVFTAMKANSDKQYGTTYDFPSICTKTQAVIDAMSAMMVKEGRGLSSQEIVELYRKTQEIGNPVPCPECYVFSRWIGIGGLLDNIKRYQDRFGKMTPAQVAAEYRKMSAQIEEASKELGLTYGKAKGALTAKYQKEYNALKEKIETQENQGERVKPEDRNRLEAMEAQVDTVKAASWIRDVYFADSAMTKVNPKWRVPDEVLFDLNRGEEFASGYKAAWGFRTGQGAGYGKAITPYAEATLGEGILVTNNTSRTIKLKAKAHSNAGLDNPFLRQSGQLDKETRKILDRARVKQKIQAFLGGQRFQSTSDARYENASDYLLAALEMQAMGGMVQCYTKVDGAVAAFNTWGFSTNQSLMPRGGGLDADGKPKDTNVGGMNKNVAKRNREKFESAGTITIGVNDNHIRAMFGEYFRDFIIPYHASGGNANVVAQFRTIQEGKEARGEGVRSTDYTRTQGDKVLSDEVLRWQGKSEAEIRLIDDRRKARIAIMTGGKADMKIVRGSRFLSELYDRFHGGEWDGVKLAKGKISGQIFPNEFWDKAVGYEDSGKITQDYLDYCEELGFLHRFSGMVPSNGMLVPVTGYDQNGNRVKLTDLAYKYDEDGNQTGEIEPFFWKLLTDRRMYGNDGQYLPQKKITLTTTTADTVAGFARGNVGKEYDRAKADRLVAEITGGKKYSLRTDSQGRELSREQMEYFRDSKVRDAQGRLIPVYHGTRSMGFTVFDPWYSDDKTSLFFSAGKSTARTYSDSFGRESDTYAIDRDTDMGQFSGGISGEALRSALRDVGYEMTSSEMVTDRAEAESLARRLREEYTELAGMDGAPMEQMFQKQMAADLAEEALSVDDRWYRVRAEYLGDEILIDRKNAELIARKANPSVGLYEVYLNLTNPFILDCKGRYWNDIGYDALKGDGVPKYEGSKTRDVTAWAKANGYDGVIFENLVDLGGFEPHADEEVGSDTVYVAFSPEQVKSTANKTPTSDQDIRFSLRDPQQTKTSAQLAKENQRLREDVAKLKDLIKLQRTVTNGTKFTKTSVDSSAGKLIKDTGATGAKAELSKLLNDFYEAVVKQEEPTLEAVQAAAEPSVEWLMGHIDLDGMTVAEQMMLRQEILGEVYDSYWNVSTLRTFADVKQAQINKLRGEHLKRMADLRAKHRAKVQELKKEHREQIKAIRAEDRAEMERQQRELMERYQKSRKAATEGRHRTEMRHKIQKVVKQLDDMLRHETKDRHVPERLKAVVAEALELFDMDTVGAAERIEDIDKRIAKATDPKKIAELMETRKRVESMGESFRSRMEALKSAYAEIKAEADPELRAAFDSVIESKLEEAAQTVGNTSLRNMSMEQLEAVYDAYKMILNNIRDANKAFVGARKETVSQMGQAADQEVRKTGGNHRTTAKLLGGIKGFSWQNLKPVYAMRTIGSKTLTELYQNLRRGEDTWVTDIQEAKDFFRQKRQEYGYDKWDFDKTWQFESTTGVKFKLNLQQIMSIYAYSRRDQAGEHLRKGGFVYDSSTEVKRNWKGIPYKATVNTADAHNLSAEVIGEIIGKLTDEQRKFVEAMQSYLSETMGGKGNEVSMAMYDIRLFKEKNYFPLKSANQFIFEQTEAAGEIKLKNSGFTKGTTPKASNPIILRDFMDVWAGHVNDMSLYHAMVLPLEDFNRVLNYQGINTAETDSASVKQAIQNAYGKQAVDYLSQMLKDINGGARMDSRAGFTNKLMSLFKKGATFGSLSVVVQQPSSIARAWAVIDPKYFIGGKIDGKKHSQAWEELKKYAPVARIKEMGQFDVGMGRTTKDYITAPEYSSFKEKAKAMISDSNFRDEILGRLPALADEVTWVAIWDAVKRETAQKKPGLKRGSEEFMKAAGERFTEIVTMTQVYDSVFSRSAMMRSKDTGVKMTTAFMAEPTTTANMVADAIIQGKRGNKKYAAAAIASVITSNLLNAMLASFVYAARDEDEDETYLEKYLSSFTGKFFDSLNPATYIPLLKDVVSIVGGYDVERSDMTLFADIWQAWQRLDSENLSAWRKIEDFAGSIAKLGGFPLKNIMRDMRALWNVFSKTLPASEGTGAGIRYAIREGVPWWLGGGKESNAQQLYDAYLRGDMAHAARIAGRYESQSAVNTALRAALRENDPRILAMANARMSGDVRLYYDLLNAMKAEGHFTDNIIIGAVNAEVNSLKDDSSQETSTSKELSAFTADDFGYVLMDGDKEMLGIVRDEIIQTYMDNGKTMEEAQKAFYSTATEQIHELFDRGELTEKEAISALETYSGKTREEAESDIGKRAFKNEYGFDWSDRGDAYKSGMITRAELIKVLMDVGGKTKEEAELQAEVYDWEKEIPGCDISGSYIEKYNTYCAGVGISREVYYDVLEFYRDSGTVGVAYSAVKECMPYIASLNLTADQKTALALSFWSESTVRRYKTW